MKTWLRPPGRIIDYRFEDAIAYRHYRQLKYLRTDLNSPSEIVWPKDGELRPSIARGEYSIYDGQGEVAIETWKTSYDIDSLLVIHIIGQIVAKYGDERCWDIIASEIRNYTARDKSGVGFVMAYTTECMTISCNNEQVYQRIHHDIHLTVGHVAAMSLVSTYSMGKIVFRLGPKRDFNSGVGTAARYLAHRKDVVGIRRCLTVRDEQMHIDMNSLVSAFIRVCIRDDITDSLELLLTGTQLPDETITHLSRVRKFGVAIVFAAIRSVDLRSSNVLNFIHAHYGNELLSPALYAICDNSWIPYPVIKWLVRTYGGKEKMIEIMQDQALRENVRQMCEIYLAHYRI